MQTPPLITGLFLLALAGCSGADDTSKGPGDASSSSAPTSSSSPTGASAAASDPATFRNAWEDRTRKAIGKTAEWTNKVEIADLDGDGDPDLLFANGGDYESPGTPVASRVFENDGSGGFTDATQRVLNGLKTLTRVIKVADLDGDRRPDIVLGTTFHTQSRLFLGGHGGWTDVTATGFPKQRLSVGDLEPGDVDGDGDLDLVLADWGKGSPLTNGGGLVRLWLNDGSGRFEDVTADRMPTALVRFSWDLELLDVDNDWDLDVVTSCKLCATGRLYLNDGAGTFEDVTDQGMPASANNYDFAPLDLDRDGYLDLVTVNDGASTAQGFAELVFRNDGQGGFVDATDDWWPLESNVGWDDNVAVGLDVESDGDPDFVIGSLDGPDRLLLDDGTGHLTLADHVFDGTPSRGTLGMAVADLDGDGRPDVVEGQGEVPGQDEERVWMGTGVLSPDSAPPVVRAERVGDVVLSRIHDNTTTEQGYEWRSLVVRWTGGHEEPTWYGEHLFRADVPADAEDVEVCATDAAGNRSCDNAA